VSIVADIALVVIAVVLMGLLTAIKTGFSEVIKGLEAIHEELARRSS
jgi:Flp pilus assembly pilin Flp